tara:strand:- start:112 stop:579 length:468 start_codon:yes stop_codon:yes gene_type:complete
MTLTPVKFDSPSYDKYEDVKNKTIQERVLEWTNALCIALEEDYKEYTIRSAQQFPSEYGNARLERIKQGTENLMKFTYTVGKKYIKIVQKDWNDRENCYEGGGVHAFVDKNTGEVYKPASWRAPAKHVRYDLRIIQERQACYNRASWAGGYLYLR